MELSRSCEVVGENDGDDMSEDEGGEVEIRRINNTENDIQEAVTNVMFRDRP